MSGERGMGTGIGGMLGFEGGFGVEWGEAGGGVMRGWWWDWGRRRREDGCELFLSLGCFGDFACGYLVMIGDDRWFRLFG
jgi:hypothetical protein